MAVDKLSQKGIMGQGMKQTGSGIAISRCKSSLELINDVMISIPDATTFMAINDNLFSALKA